MKKRVRREDRMLELIELRKDAEILDERKKTKTLNKLQRYGLIELSDRGCGLTDKGRVAREMGVEAYIQCELLEKQISGFTLERSKRKGNFILGAFFLLVITLFVTLAVTIMI